MEERNMENSEIWNYGASAQANKGATRANCSLDTSNCRIHDTIHGVTDTDATPGHEDARERDEETDEVPLGLEEWPDNGLM